MAAATVDAMNSLKRTRVESRLREVEDFSTINVQPPESPRVASSSTAGSPAAKRVRVKARSAKDKYDAGIPVYARVPNDPGYDSRIDFRTFVEDIGPNVPRALLTGNVNAGLYIERFARSTEADGTVYKDKAVFSEYKRLNVGGELKEEIVFDGVTYMRIGGGPHDGKLVQQIGPKSFINFEGKTHVEWNIRVEEKLGF